MTKVYRRREPPEDLLPDRNAVLPEAGYVDLDGDGNWWKPSGRIFYAAEEGDGAEHELAEALRHFFVARRYCDPFSSVTRIDYDRHDLAPIETTDPLGNVIRAEFDYRALSPRLVADPNGNRSAVAFDALGLVAGTVMMGKVGENLGDTLDGFAPDLTAAEVASFFGDPHGSAVGLLANATTRVVYDVERYFATREPVFAAMLARETHVPDLRPSELSKTQISLHYSDGFGREIQAKQQAAPGPVAEGGPETAPRWIGSGWTISNNKGKPVRQYEPFFTASHDFEFAAIRGVSPILFYDPVERGVATLKPEKTFAKVVFDPWRQTSWDANDTVTADPPPIRMSVRIFNTFPNRIICRTGSAGGSAAIWARPKRQPRKKPPATPTPQPPPVSTRSAGSFSASTTMAATGSTAQDSRHPLDTGAPRIRNKRGKNGE